MKICDVTCARKYAKAFLNVWPKAVSPDLFERLVAFEEALVAQRRILFVLSLSYVERETTLKRIKGVCDRFDLSWHFARLIEQLLVDKRIFLLPDVLRSIRMLYARRNNLLEVCIKSSMPLGKAACNTLVQFLARASGAHVEYRVQVDHSLIAGIRIESGNLLWEHSIKKQLRSMAHADYHIEGAHE